jgi:hypothetical protein
MGLKKRYQQEATPCCVPTPACAKAQFMPTFIKAYYRYWFAAPAIGFVFGLLLTYCYLNSEVNVARQYDLKADEGRTLLQGGGWLMIPGLVLLTISLVELL